ncbi:tyrosine-type recombinase/integrase [Halobacillus aidingensis]|uniref:Integrase/recombinase XerD n=1 Tax=Halobacillus aidingensis TaxID=240303 RepID=A0A1H0MER2_HALAD|nr:tyrosine-type recombinase/integrase [Halobacillus aidingensis]SDO78847.1 integrase/recombinase XerD [Halobacillus aidingensis]
MKLSEAWEQYELDRQLEGYSPYTLKSYKLQSRLFIEHAGDLELEEVDFKMIKAYLAKDAKRLKPSSIANRMKYFKALFKWAVNEGLIVGNPAAKLREPKQGPRIPKAMREEEIENLREACETPLEHAIIEAFFTTGCRIGEIAKLNRNAINWEDRSIVVIGKGDKEREVYFSIKCGIWLKKYLNSRDDMNTSLFVTERRYKSEGGQPRKMSIPQLRWVIKRIARRAGIENVYPHKLRHSYATHLLNNDAPMEVIQSFLGHSNIKTTYLYAQLSGERRRQLYKKYF